MSISEKYLQIVYEFVPKVEGKHLAKIAFSSLDEPRQKELRTQLREFWSHNADSAVQATRGFEGTKAVYWPAERISDIPRLISRSGLLFDKIVIADPVLNTLQVYGYKSYFKISRLLRDAQFLRQVESAMALGIVDVIPDIASLDPKIGKTMFRLGDIDSENPRWRSMCLDDPVSGLRGEALLTHIDEIIRRTRERKWIKHVGLRARSEALLFKTPATYVNRTLSLGESVAGTITTDNERRWKQLECKLSIDKSTLDDAALTFRELSKINLPLFDGFSADTITWAREKGYLDDFRAYFADKLKELRSLSSTGVTTRQLEAIGAEINENVRKHKRQWKEIKDSLLRRIGLKAGIKAPIYSAVMLSSTILSGTTVDSFVTWAISAGILTDASFSLREVENLISNYLDERARMKHDFIHMFLKEGTKA